MIVHRHFLLLTNIIYLLIQYYHIHRTKLMKISKTFGSFCFQHSKRTADILKDMQDCTNRNSSFLKAAGDLNRMYNYDSQFKTQ